MRIGRAGGGFATAPRGKVSALARALRVGAVIALLMVLPALPASAHATLSEITPADASVLPKAPAEVVLRYDEAVDTALGAVKILAPDGATVPTGKVGSRDDGRTVFVSLTSALPAGTYTVLWRVLSEDSHSIAGASTFSVGQASPTAGAAAAAAAQQTGGGGAAKDLLVVARVLAYAGLVLLIGGCAFLLLLWPAGAAVPRARRLLWVGWGLTVVGTVAGLLLEGPYGAGQSPTSALDPTLIANVAGTRYGISLLVRLVLLAAWAALLIGLRRIGRPVLIAGCAALGVGVLITTSVVGHAGTGGFAALALPADALHLAAASLWLGGLAVLATVMLGRDTSELDTVLPRWSRYAATCVAVLVATGSFAAWLQVRELDALVGSTYGRLLLIKIGLVILMLGLAAMARAWVRRRYGPPSELPSELPPSELPPSELPPSGRSEPAAGSGTTATLVASQVVARPNTVGLRRSVLLEVILAVGVLVVTALLVGTTPGRDYYPVFDRTGPVTSALQVRVDVAPARAGLNDMHLTYTGMGGKLTDVVQVTARWSRAGSTEVVPVQLVRSSLGTYDRLRVALPAAGKWKLAVTTQTSDIDATTTVFSVRVR